jgi:hypothetical protein
MEKWKFLPHRDSNSDSSFLQPVASRYTDWAIPAPSSLVTPLKFIYSSIQVSYVLDVTVRCKRLILFVIVITIIMYMYLWIIRFSTHNGLTIGNVLLLLFSPINDNFDFHGIVAIITVINIIIIIVIIIVLYTVFLYILLVRFLCLSTYSC